MYRGNSKGKRCVLVKAYKVPKNTIKVYSTPIFDLLKVDTSNLDKIKVVASFIDRCKLQSLAFSTESFSLKRAKKITEELNLRCESKTPLKISCGIVCTRSQLDKILEVSPNYIFLSKSNNFTDDVYIISNVVWDIN